MDSFEAQDMTLSDYHTFSWEQLTFKIKNELTLLHPQTGSIASGQLLAILGPSGAGKTTLLNILAKRQVKGTSGQLLFDGRQDFRLSDISAYVEQEDALLDTLTVRETFSFTSRLHACKIREDASIRHNLDYTLAQLGLTDVQNTKIGSVLRRGISGGQKRRTTLGTATITLPNLLFLDEVTSGLDSAAAFHVVSALRRLAQEQSLMVIASIHQPQHATLALFDQLIVLAKGHTVYQGSVEGLPVFCSKENLPVPSHTNSIDHFMNLVNSDFEQSTSIIAERIRTFAARAAQAEKGQSKEKLLSSPLDIPILAYGNRISKKKKSFAETAYRFIKIFYLLSMRIFINYRRNLLAYGVRMVLYFAMGLLMALIWTKLPNGQDRVQDRFSVLFFGVAFLSFMSVAGIPAFLTERAVYLRETKNGLYTAGPYVLAHTAVNIVFLSLCVILFSVMSYWSIGLRSGPQRFFRFVLYVFLTAFTAESQTTLIAALLPDFMAASASAAFLNGFWMCVGGYFNRHLATFWRKSFHYMDYQTYALQLLTTNEFKGETIGCETTNNGCYCMYPSSIQASGQCASTGEDIIKALGFENVNVANWLIILISISVIYRLLLYVVLASIRR